MEQKIGSFFFFKKILPRICTVVRMWSLQHSICIDHIRSTSTSSSRCDHAMVNITPTTYVVNAYMPCCNDHIRTTVQNHGNFFLYWHTCIIGSGIETDFFRSVSKRTL